MTCKRAVKDSNIRNSFYLKPESKNTQDGGGGDAPPAGSPLHSVGRMLVMWLLLDGKKGLVYQRPEIIGDFLETPSRFPRRRCLIATFSAELYR
jgi:hypothetical protein